MTYLLDLGDGSPLIRCRDQHQALSFARLWVAFCTGAAAVEIHPSAGEDDGRIAVSRPRE